MPDISVITSLWQEDRDIFKKCVESVLLQSFNNFEWIIVNDGTQKENWDYLQSLDDSRLVLMENQSNMGLTLSLNKAVTKAQGRYLARMDSDDVCLPERLQKQFDYMEQNPDVILCGSAYQEINKDQISSAQVPFVSSDVEIRRSFKSFNPIAHPTFFMRKTAFLQVGGYNPAFRYAQDYEFLGRLLKIGKVVNLQEKLLLRRVADNQISKAHEKEQLYYSLRVRLKALYSFGPSLNGLWSILKSIVKIMLLTLNIPHHNQHKELL